METNAGSADLLAATESTRSRELADVLRMLKRRWKLVGVVCATFVVAAGVITVLQHRVYEASATLVIESTTANDPFQQTQDPYGAAQRRVATEAKVVQSDQVQDLVRRKLGTAPSISVMGATDADVITINARSQSARRAAEVANAYASAYVDVKREQGVQGLQAASDQVRGRVNDMQRQIDALDRQVQSAPPAERANLALSVSQQRTSLLNQQATFRSTLNELQVRIALASGDARVVAPASVPTHAVEPRPIRTTGLALVLGLVSALGLVFVLENLDDRIRSKSDLERVSGGHPVLGLIPSHEADGLPVSLSQPASDASEAYRTLRTAVQFMGLDRKLEILQVTSPNPGEGKTTTVVNLGLTLAYAGVRVCLVDCDLRRPRLANAFGLTPSVGFTSVLLGTCTLDDAMLVSETWGALLSLLPSGPIPPNPSELLSSPRVQKFFDELTQRCDLVIVDTPPALPVSDALAASRLADAVLMVTTANSSTRKGVQRALELMRNVGAPVAGTVLNKADQGDKDEYSYAASGGYARDLLADSASNDQVSTIEISRPISV
jgi:succinoglycan biosynthesis transport protein ExoP